MTKDLSIPTWGDVVAKENRGEPLTAIDKFVYDNEPADEPGERIFRSGLAAVLAQARAAHEPPAEPAAWAEYVDGRIVGVYENSPVLLDEAKARSADLVPLYLQPTQPPGADRREIDHLRHALLLIRSGPPPHMGNSEVASWAACIASAALLPTLTKISECQHKTIIHHGEGLGSSCFDCGVKP
jgi:hypothetical protein